MKRKMILLALIAAISMASSAAATMPVVQTIPYSLRVSLPVPVTYIFRFSLWDDPSGGYEVWSEQKSIAVKSTTVSTQLGDKTLGGLQGIDLNKQLWVKTQYKTKASAAYKTIGARAKLGVVPYALWCATAADILGFNSSVIQARVHENCAAGNAIRTVNFDGSVVCEPVTGGTGSGDHHGRRRG